MLPRMVIRCDQRRPSSRDTSMKTHVGFTEPRARSADETEPVRTQSATLVSPMQVLVDQSPRMAAQRRCIDSLFAPPPATLPTRTANPVQRVQASFTITETAEEEPKKTPAKESSAVVSTPETKGKVAPVTKVMTVDASSELDPFEPTQHVSNGLPIPVRPLTTKAQTPAYVANIVTTASGKDKTASQVADQYANEAFDSKQDARQRFAMVLLANREELPTAERDEQATPLAAASTDQVGAIKDFPAAVGRVFWHRKWSMGPKGDRQESCSVSAIRNLMAKASDPDAASKAILAATRAAGLPRGVPNAARNAVRAMPQTAQWLQAFAARKYQAFAHVADADAVTLKATRSEDGTGAEASLFSRYDEILTARPSIEAVGGGYRFAHRPDVGEGLPAHAAGAGDDGKGLMAQTSQSIETNKLDVSVRTAMGNIHRGMPYLPEPNLVVRGDLYARAGVDFGNDGTEWLKLRSKMLQEGQTLRGPEAFTRLKGEEIKTLCKFPTTSRTELAWSLDASRFKPFKSREWNGKLRCKVEVEDPNHFVVFLPKADIERALGKTWARQMSFEFDPSAALVTDVGRFDKPYVESSGDGRGTTSGTDYLNGETDPLALFDPARAHQSHAQWGAIKTTVERAYGLTKTSDTDWLVQIMRVLLPQSLFSDIGETRDSYGTLAERTAASRDELIRVQPALNHFDSFTAAILEEVQQPQLLRDQANTLWKKNGERLSARDKQDLIQTRLEARGVHADFLNELSGSNLLAIWDALVSPRQPRNVSDVTEAVKAIGDAIAEFLATY